MVKMERVREFVSIMVVGLYTTSSRRHHDRPLAAVIITTVFRKNRVGLWQKANGGLCFGMCYRQLVIECSSDEHSVCVLFFAKQNRYWYFLLRTTRRHPSLACRREFSF